MIDINEQGNPYWKEDDGQRSTHPQAKQSTGPYSVTFPPVRYNGNGVTLTYKLAEPMTFDGVLQELVRLNLHTHNRIKAVTFTLADW